MPLAPASRARLQATAACLGTLVLAWRFPGPVTFSLVTLATVLALLAWIAPRHYTPVQRAFDFLTHALLAALTWCVLALVYFSLFTPLRVWRTLTRNDPLALRPAPEPSTYFRAIPSQRAPNFDRQF